jgi:hypothetical protein
MEFFRKRFDLHSRLYQHKTHGALAGMICDILSLADPYFRIAVPSLSGTAPETVPISQAMLNARSYLMLRDSVIDQIANTTAPELEPARRLIARLWSRDLYKCVGTKSINMDDPMDAELWSKSSENNIVQQLLAVRGVEGGGARLIAENLFIHKVSIHCGLRERNPVSNVRFLERRNIPMLRQPIAELPIAIKVEESCYAASIPRSFMSNIVRIYCRDPSKTELAGHVYLQWLAEMKRELGQTYNDADGDSFAPRLLTQDDSDNEDNASDCETEDDGSHRVQRSHTVAAVTPLKRRYDDSE